MTAVVTFEDQLEGPSAIETKDGLQIVRSALVTGLDDISREQRLIQALRGAPDMPRIGERYPGQSITVINKSASFEGNNVRVLLSYGKDPEETSGAGETGRGRVSINADTLTVDEDKDIKGRALISKYLSASFVLTERRHTVQVDRPVVTLRLRRTESSLPVSKVFDFTGTVNKRRWAGKPKETWFCRGISVDENAEERFELVYTFSFRPERWKAIIRAKINGLIPADAIIKNGINEVDVYKLMDFNRLGVSL